ncbi:hypothetical protein B0T25DRAFT_523580 [Lasiosphaeria hispida]|uniref:DUF7730 domain-containing protein n=1 Tax=Lasiosphaeria hispida TaxID=260671 RepID=A0AAJ0H5V5_9PEZI|nr:hypothetical protein B0T25DRAFT_523580 [Lasiosphaeria hispida]
MNASAVLNGSVTMDGQPTLGFLSFSASTRNKVYKLALCYESSCSSSVQLSPQLLRTCRQIYAEAMPILYGENTFRFEIYNTSGPYYDNFHYPKAVSHDFRQNPRRPTAKVLPRLTRFSIRVNYTDCHKIAPIREAARELVSHLQGVPTIDFLRLECQLDCGDEADAHYRDPCWDEYTVDDGGREEVIGMLKTWLGRLRNVKTAAVEGLPEPDANTIKERWQSSEPLEKSPLPDMYELLEKHAKGLDFCKQDLRAALLACETDEMEDFRTHRTAILDKMRRRWEDMNKELTLRDPREDGDGSG